jgi:hypothetical protein
VRVVVAGAAGALGAAAIAYPFTLSPATNVAPLAGASLLLVAATLLLRWSALVAVAGAAIGLEYGVALLSGATVLDPFVALFAAVWLLHMELLYLACADYGDVVDRVGAGRRLLRAVVSALVGCFVALLAQLGASLGYGASGWVVVVAALCAVGALALIPVLGRGALGEGDAGAPGRP